MKRRNERSQREAGLQKANGIMSTLLARKGYGHVQAAKELTNAWVAVVGEEMAKYTRANKINGGKLEVTVANSSVMQELAFQQNTLLKQIQKQLPDQPIRELRFRVGCIS